ncbi:MAG: paraquat-inducible protein A [Alphaproteobacteria bacterium]
MTPRVETLAQEAQGIDRLIGAGLAAAVVLLGLGLLVPMISVSKLFLFEERMSVLRGLEILAGEGEWVLLGIVVVFSVLFPVAKIGLSARLWYGGKIDARDLRKQLGWLDFAGKWSMLDVFVVAIVVSAVKVSVVSAVATHPGLYLFCGAIGLSMVLNQRIAALARVRLKGMQDE